MARLLRPALIFLAGVAVGGAWVMGVILLDIDLNSDTYDGMWEG